MRRLSGDGESDPNSPSEFEMDPLDQDPIQTLSPDSTGSETTGDYREVKFEDSYKTKTREEILASRAKKARQPIPVASLENGPTRLPNLKPAGGRRSRIPDPYQVKVPTDNSKHVMSPITNAQHPVPNDAKHIQTQNSQVPNKPKGVPTSSSPKKVLSPLGRGAGALRQLISKHSPAAELPRSQNRASSNSAAHGPVCIPDYSTSNHTHVPKIEPCMTSKMSAASQVNFNENAQVRHFDETDDVLGTGYVLFSHTFILHFRILILM